MWLGGIGFGKMLNGLLLLVLSWVLLLHSINGGGNLKWIIEKNMHWN